MSTRREQRRLRLITVLVTIVTAILAGVLPSFAYTTATGGWNNFPNNGRYRGLGNDVHWLGSYAVKPAGSSSFLVVYCMYPHKNGPSTAGGYGGIVRTSNLHLDTGATMSARAVDETAYILWRWGSTNDATQSAAVAAAAFSAEGYPDYNLNNPSSWGSQEATQDGVRALALSYLAQAAEYAGPYTLKLRTVPTSPTAGHTITVDAQLISATGHAVPGVSMQLTFDGTTHTATSNSAGTASSKFTAPASGAYKATAYASNVAPDTLSTVYPHSSAAQELLVAGDSAHISNTITGRAKSPVPTVITQANAATAVPGTPLHDVVTVSGADTGYTTKATATLYGPYPAQPTSSDCKAAQAAGKVQFTISGNGQFSTPAVTPTAAGYYSWVEVLPADTATGTPEIDTPCGAVAETTLLNNQPVLATQASDQLVYAGGTLHDTVKVTGTGGNNIAVNWSLLGPVAAGANKSCANLNWSGAATLDHGTFTANGDGTYTTSTTTISTVGCYSYVETSPATTSTAAATSQAGQVAETALVDKHQPLFVTQASSQAGYVGMQVHDTVAVSGTAGTPITVAWTLEGPLAPGPDGTCDSVNWTGAPVADHGTFTANGDGTYTTSTTALAASGCYTYLESSPEGTAVWAGTSPAGQTAETVLVEKYQPAAVTQISSQNVEIGGQVHDTINVTGTQGATLDVAWTLEGPLAPNTTGTCTGLDWTNAPTAATGTLTAKGDGTYTTPAETINALGCYTYIEEAAATGTTYPVNTPAGQASETTLVDKHHPALVTTASAQQAAAGDSIHDTVTVTDPGSAPLPMTWTLLGPVAAPTAGNCSGIDWSTAPTVDHGTITVNGPGDITTPATTLTATGCYTYTEATAGTAATWPATSTPGQAAETVIVAPNTPTVHTTASAQKVAIGGTLADTVVLAGTNHQPVTVNWTLLGPIAPSSTTTCQGLDWSKAPLADTGSLSAAGDGTYTTKATLVKQAGCYTYTESLPATSATAPVTTLPGAPTETTLVTEHQPAFVTRASAENMLLGGRIHDSVDVTGLAPGDSIVVKWALLGPVAPQGLTCNNASWGAAHVVAKGTLTVTANGTYETKPVKVAAVGCYTYMEGAAATSTTNGAVTLPGVPEETVLVTRTPLPRTPAVPTGGYSNPLLPGSSPSATGIWLGAGIGLLGGIAGTMIMARRRRTAV